MTCVRKCVGATNFVPDNKPVEEGPQPRKKPTKDGSWVYVNYPPPSDENNEETPFYPNTSANQEYDPIYGQYDSNLANKVLHSEPGTAVPEKTVTLDLDLKEEEFYDDMQ